MNFLENFGKDKQKQSQSQSNSHSSDNSTQIDYQSLYRQEKRRRKHYQKKAQEIQAKIRALTQPTRVSKFHDHLLSPNKQMIQGRASKASKLSKMSQALGDTINLSIINQLKLFKAQMDFSMSKSNGFFKKNLQNSIEQKQQQSEQSEERQDSSMEQQYHDAQYPIIKNFAVYGITQFSVQSKQQNQMIPLDTLFTAQLPTQQIWEAADRLNQIRYQRSQIETILLQGQGFEKIDGQQLIEKNEILKTFNYNQLKSFILNFYPKKDSQINKNSGQFKRKQKLNNKKNVLNFLNSDRMIYCLCLEVPSLTFMENTNQQAGYSHRFYCIFSYYPVFSFLDELLKGMLNIIKMEKLLNTDPSKKLDSNYQLQRIKQINFEFIKKFNNQVSNQCLKSTSFNQIYELSFKNSISIKQLSQDNCRSTDSSKQDIKSQHNLIKQIYYNDKNDPLVQHSNKNICFFIDRNIENYRNLNLSPWINPFFRISNYQTFLRIFLFILFQEKVIFISESQYLLTSTIYLFSKELIRPFAYQKKIDSILVISQNNLKRIKDEDISIIGFIGNQTSFEKQKLYIELNQFHQVYLQKDKVNIVLSKAKQTLFKNIPDLNLKNQIQPLFPPILLQKSKSFNFLLKIQNTFKSEQKLPINEKYIFSSSKQQTEKYLKIVEIISNFFQSKIVSLIPTKKQIQLFIKKYQRDNKKQHKNNEKHLIKLMENSVLQKIIKLKAKCQNYEVQDYYLVERFIKNSSIFRQYITQQFAKKIQRKKRILVSMQYKIQKNQRMF